MWQREGEPRSWRARRRPEPGISGKRQTPLPAPSDIILSDRGDQGVVKVHSRAERS